MQQAAQQFKAFVQYIQPGFEELQRRFKPYVNPEYKSRLDPIERCKTVSRESREVTFEFVCMNRTASSDEVLNELNRRGLRHALYEEFLGFTEKYPDEVLRGHIVALGSATAKDGWDYAACLSSDGICRYLDLRQSSIFSSSVFWNGYARFLAVRE